MRLFLVVVAGLAWLAVCSAAAYADEPRDLNPVTKKPVDPHAPVVLVRDGKPVGSICVQGARSPRLNEALTHLQTFIEKSTGAKLPIVEKEIRAPAIVIGGGEFAIQHGIDVTAFPIEGFAIRTTADSVIIAGRDEQLAGAARSEGTAWGVIEFLERFVGVRWYFPTELGQSIPQASSLSIPPTWIEDAPVFRMRVIWPPMSNPWNGTGTPLMPVQNFLRAGNSWPAEIKVHQPNWATVEDYKTNRPEVFQQRSDGTRDHFMLCYGHPRTLATYLENIDRHVRNQAPVHVGISGNAITVSPNDAEVACYCEHCRKLWNADGGQYGSASKVVANFVAELAAEVKQRWPDKSVIYLPYLNYTLAPAGVSFPDNVEVQICGMPGLAMYKEPLVLAEDQANVDAWVKLSGRRIQNWHYSCWPANRTKAVYQYPHVVKAFYEQNRDKTVGTFINGETDHWPRHHPSLYCWMKVLWNPAFDVDAALTEYCRRMYGPAAATVGELLALQTGAWEKSRWPGGRLSPKAVHEISFPKDRVARMAALLAQARDEARSDPLALQRLDYLAAPLQEFFEESRNYYSGEGLKPLLVQKVGENPKVDGELNEPAWKRAEARNLMRGWDKKQKDVSYPTEVRAVWTAEGVTFGFRMTEPTPEVLERKIRGQDDSMAWWDDNIELLFDVTGKNEGEFYHFIVNPNAAVADAKGKDFSWNVTGMTTAAHVGEGFWSLEIHYPWSAFPECAKPGSGTNTAWTGNFTRHRVADRGLNTTLKPRMGSEREYQRMNTTYAVPSNNLQDFAPLRFVE